MTPNRYAVPAALITGLAACSSSSHLKITNDTGSAVTLVSCAGDGQIDRQLPANGSFTFDDNLGTRAEPDDPGFACLLTTSAGKRLCLYLPTDQSERSAFAVTEAIATPSESACFALSNPHI